MKQTPLDKISVFPSFINLNLDKNNNSKQVKSGQSL